MSNSVCKAAVVLLATLALVACGGDSQPTGGTTVSSGAPAASAAPASAAHPGEGTYNKFCISCHGMGAAGAPRKGVAADWAERRDKGMDALVASTVNGLNAMPPMGMCRQCSEDDIRDAVVYMLEDSQ